MFFDGVDGYTPPSTPNDYNLSLGCDPAVMIPTSSIGVGVITLCGLDYSVDTTFTDQADMISFLNGTFCPAFGLIGLFSIDTNELIYTTTDDCTGTSCIALLTEGIETESGIGIETETGSQLRIE